MTLWKSTMNAPLSADEEERILRAWWALEALAQAQTELTDPVEMLDHVTDLIMAAYELRRAIGDSWNAANARAFPGPAAKPRLVVRNIPTHLDVTEDELLAALAIIRSEPTP